jgi:hypothetical protein
VGGRLFLSLNWTRRRRPIDPSKTSPRLPACLRARLPATARAKTRGGLRLLTVGWLRLALILIKEKVLLQLALAGFATGPRSLDLLTVCMVWSGTEVVWL